MTNTREELIEAIIAYGRAEQTVEADDFRIRTVRLLNRFEAEAETRGVREAVAEARDDRWMRDDWG